MLRPHRSHPLWYAYLLHRISGVTLALFLPVHFYVLGLAIENAAAFETFISWSNYPFVKMSEAVLVLLLGAHMFGGLRLMALEFLPWSSQHKTYAALSLAVSFVVSTGFFLSAV